MEGEAQGQDEDLKRRASGISQKFTSNRPHIANLGCNTESIILQQNIFANAHVERVRSM